MQLGNNKFILSIIFLLFNYSNSFSEDKILSAPLINLNELKPSFEEIDNTSDEKLTNEFIKNKKKILPESKLLSAKFIGLDKITAKTSEISIILGETKKFGPLEIKVLKCGKVNSKNENGSVAYLQVKDISKNDNEKVFIFNGWTFSSSTTLRPLDHPIYDIWLVSCDNV